MDFGIADKVALVTAGSKGLGRATALALAGEGVRVMLSGRDATTLETTRAEVAARVSTSGCWRAMSPTRANPPVLWPPR